MTTFLKFIPLLAFALAAGLAAGTEPAVAGGGCRGVASTSAEGTEVKMTGHACFTPTVLYAEPGETITWTNESSDIHDVAGATLEWGSYEELRSGESVAYAFAEPGTYPYYCFIHPGMSGAVVVGNGRSAIQAAARPVIPAAAQVQAREAPADAERAEPLAAAIASEGDEANPLVFAGLGALIGAVAVALGFGARELRRR